MQDDAGRSYFRQVFRSNPKFMRGFKRMLAPRHIIGSTQSRLNVVSVSQQRGFVVAVYRGIGALLGSTDFVDMFTNLQQDEATTPTPGLTTRKLKVNFAKAKFTIKNMTNLPVEITWYDIFARRDQDINAVVGDPFEAWNDGMLNEQALPSGAGTLTQSFPGATPFMSARFCQYFNVKRVRKYMLHAGSNHVHEVEIRPGGMFNRELVSNQRYVRGITYIPLCVVKGGVIQDTTTPFNTAYSTAEVDIICDTHYEFMAMEKSRTVYSGYSTLPAAVTTQGVMLEETNAEGVVDQV